jgi:pimeloyl-ACP methyl ester carboxylesterase
LRWIGRILKWIGVGLIALVVVGVAFQQIGLLLDAKVAPPAGDMVRVGSRGVHLACRGHGPRTYILDAGAGAGVFEWYRLQPLLAESGQACAFDRAGLGWSDSARGDQDGIAAADQLAAMVKAAGIPTPFVYVGHSLGANFAEIYQARFPRDVAALVLLEPGVPADLLEDFRGSRHDAFAANACDASCYLAGAATMVGLVRLATLSAGTKSLDERTRAIYRASIARPANLMTTIASLNATPKTAYESLDIHSFGSTPVLVFASSAPREPEGRETPSDVKRWQVAQRAYLAGLSAKSSRGGGLVIVPDATHSSMVLGEQQSDFVARTMLAFLARVGM